MTKAWVWLITAAMVIASIAYAVIAASRAWILLVSKDPLQVALAVAIIVIPVIGLALIAAFGMLAALKLWPSGDPVELEHTHDNLPLDHPHLRGHRRHSHALIIDESHPRWATHL